MNLRSAVAEFLLDRESYGRSPATIRFYRTHLTAMVEFLGGIGVEDTSGLDRSALRQWFAYLNGTKLTHNTISAHDRSIRTFCAFCRQEGWIEQDPTRGRPRIKQTRSKPDTLSLDDIRQLLDVCRDDAYGLRDRAMMLLLLDTGLRAGELVGLTLDDVELDHSSGRVHVRGETSKSHRGRTVPFQEDTSRAMRAWLEARPNVHGALFIAADGVNLGKEPLTVSGLNQRMRHLAELAGILDEHSRWCHIWRHTFAKRYVMAGGDLETLRRLLGHTSLDTVQVYLAFKQEDLERKHAQLSPVRQLFSKR